MTGPAIFVGLDVAKATLDVAVRPTGECWQVPNDEAGAAELTKRVRALGPALLVCEATGGFERPAVAALAAAGVPVVVANPRHVRRVRLAEVAVDPRALAALRHLALAIVETAVAVARVGVLVVLERVRVLDQARPGRGFDHPWERSCTARGRPARR